MERSKSTPNIKREQWHAAMGGRLARLAMEMSKAYEYRHDAAQSPAYELLEAEYHMLMTVQAEHDRADNPAPFRGLRG